ncbi:MAG: response regulator [Verrucomicrobia bacterium]|nr:response regulator [Verrucomicrobiota bacterium]
MTDPSTPTVFLVDDDVSFLRSLSRLLRAAGFRVVTHNAAAEFLGDLRSDMDGCVITDLMMPGMDGMALQRALQQAESPLPILFLSAHGDIPSTVQAMRLGAEDFLTKHAPKEELLGAVRRALARNARERAERARLEALRAPFAELTARELEVLAHVLTGQLNKQIAADLGIDERSVKRHRTGIMTKLQVQSVAQLTRLVQDAGFWHEGKLRTSGIPLA